MKTEIKNFPLISVIMLNYNGLHYIRRTVPAVQKISYPNYEFIIIDNGSTDGSLEYLRNRKGVKLLISNRTGEKNYACNFAAKKARGKYILLLDNDLLITEKDMLQHLLTEAETLPSLGSISLAYVNENEKKTKGYGCYASYYYSWEKPYVHVDDLQRMHRMEVGSPNGAGIFMKKNLWDIIGGYDSHLAFGGDDDDLGMKLWLYGYKNYLYSKTIQIHLGILERTNTEKYSKKYENKVYAHFYTIVKDYSFKNMLITIFGYSAFSFFKAIIQSAKRLSLKPLIAFIKGYFYFIKNLNTAINKRKEVQSKRLVKKDIFLKVRPLIQDMQLTRVVGQDGADLSEFLLNKEF